MNILIISDLHLGSPLFKKKYSFLTLIKSPMYGKIVLNGDILDIWEKKLKTIVEENKDIIKGINDLSKEKQVYFIKGNHDPDINEIQKIFPNVIVVNELLIQDLFIIHGDEFDSLVTKYSWLAKLLFIPHWIGERFGLNIKAFFRELTQSISNKREKSYYKELVTDINNSAIKKYSGLCKFIVMGHTHAPKILKEGECTYINGGDLIHNHTYVEFNVLDNTFNLKRI